MTVLDRPGVKRKAWAITGLVRYEGVVPDPFREGREVIVSGELQGGTFVAERDSLITKCPSKFTKDESS